MEIKGVETEYIQQKKTVWRNWNKCQNLVKTFGQYQNKNKRGKTIFYKDRGKHFKYKLTFQTRTLMNF